MSRFECERWASIVDRRLLDEPHDASDLRFEAEHAAACDACGRERARWAELAALPPPVVPVPAASALTDSLRARMGAQPAARVARAPWRPGGAAIASAAVAAAAAVALLVWRSPQTSTSPAAPARAAAVVVTSGPDQQAGSLAEGAWLRTAATPLCLFIEPGVRACLAPQSEVTIADLRLATRRLALVSGRINVSLDPQPPGSSFTIATRDGDVTAVGTLFAVEVPPHGGPVEAFVVHGAVRVGGGRTSATLRASQKATVAQPRPRAIEQEDQPRLLEETRLSELIGRADDPLVDVAVAQDQAAITIDGAPVGRGRMAVRLPPGPHTVAAFADGHQPWSEQIEVQSGQPVARAITLAGIKADVRHVAPRAPAAAPISRWLDEARGRRGRGDYAGAATFYKRVYAAQPRSPEGCAALLALAELELKELDAPAAALRSFEAYLRSGDDVLAAEAELGRIHALRQLGRAADERLAIERFIARHPSSVGVAGLKQRLRELAAP